MALTSSHYGTYRVEMENGKPARLHGFEADPDPSPIGQAMLDTLEGPCRVNAPMVRKGYLKHGPHSERNLRGQDEYVAVGWDQALDLAAGELDRVRRKSGNSAIYAGSYGWASAGRFHHAQSQLRRFMNLFGGATTSRDSYSYAAAEVILPYVVGSMGDLLQRHTSWRAVAGAGSLVVAFGGMALRNAAVNPGGNGRHNQTHDMRAAHQAGARFVNISPARTDVLEELEADWLAIRPNTDMALMLAIAHTLVAEDLHDKAFLERYCTGFDRFLPYLTGADDGKPKDADWAAGITGIAADKITGLARRMAAGPTLINASWSLTRQQNGEQNYWMLVVLAAMLGDIGVPGCGFALGLGAISGVGSDRVILPWAALPTGSDPETSFIPVARISDMLLNPGGLYSYNGQTREYPDIRLVYWAGGNPFHHHQDLNRLCRAWQQIETVIVHEPFWTPLARRADIVFPAAVGLERNDIAASSRDDWIVYSQQAVRPYGEARCDYDIFTGLAHRLSLGDGSNGKFEDAFTLGRSEQQWLRELYAQTQARAAALGHELPDYDDFVEQGAVRLAPPDKAVTLLEAFRADPEGSRLPTPSGRIEIFSRTIADFNLDQIPGHPVWREPDEWLESDVAKKYPLHLTTHQPARRLHSQLDHSAHSRDGKINGREPCRINPADAAPRGLKPDDMVRIFNDRGSCISAVEIDDAVRPGVLMMATGAWYDPGYGGDEDCCKQGNPNTLTRDAPTSELAQGPRALTCLVDVERLTAPAPAVTAFDPPRIRTEDGNIQ